MGTIQKLFFTFFTLMVAAIGAAVFVLYSAGQFRTITPNFNGHCVAVTDIAGPEDIALHPSGNYAFISSDNRRQTAKGTPVPGAIYLYDLKDPSVAPVNLTPDSDENFHPLGLSFFQGEDGRATLMVVNRQSISPTLDKPNKIEIYVWKDGALTHRKTIGGFLSPNDIAAIDHDKFYATNDHGFVGDFSAFLESYVPLPVGKVGYYDGKKIFPVADGLHFANGISLSSDQKTLFVAETVGQNLRIYARNEATNALVLMETRDLGTGPDNISLGANGEIWIASHPQLLSFLGHASDPSKHAPSQVLRLIKGGAGQFVVNEVLLDAGDLISGASVAVSIGNRVLIGAVFEKKFLDCSL